METKKRQFYNKGEIIVITSGEYSDYQIQSIYEVLIDNFDITQLDTIEQSIIAEASGLVKELNYIEYNNECIGEWPGYKNSDMLDIKKEYIKELQEYIRRDRKKLEDYEQAKENFINHKIDIEDEELIELNNRIGYYQDQIAYNQERIAECYDFIERMKPYIEKIKKGENK